VVSLGIKEKGTAPPPAFYLSLMSPSLLRLFHYPTQATHSSVGSTLDSISLYPNESRPYWLLAVLKQLYNRIALVVQIFKILDSQYSASE